MLFGFRNLCKALKTAGRPAPQAGREHLPHRAPKRDPPWGNPSPGFPGTLKQSAKLTLQSLPDRFWRHFDRQQPRQQVGWASCDFAAVCYVFGIVGDLHCELVHGKKALHLKVPPTARLARDFWLVCSESQRQVSAVHGPMAHRFMHTEHMPSEADRWWRLVVGEVRKAEGIWKSAATDLPGPFGNSCNDFRSQPEHAEGTELKRLRALLVALNLEDDCVTGIEVITEACSHPGHVQHVMLGLRFQTCSRDFLKLTTQVMAGCCLCGS